LHPNPLIMTASFLLACGEAAYVAFIFLKAKEVCELISGVDESTFCSSHARQHEVISCLRAIEEADDKITGHLRQDLNISWEILSQVKALDKRNIPNVWEAVTSIIPRLKTDIEQLNPKFVSHATGTDSLLLKAGTHIPKGTSLSFFHDEPGLSARTATERQEADIAAWLLDRRIVKQWLTAASGIPSNSIHFTGVTTPLLTESTEVGDIDALLFPIDNLCEAAAMECKRVKAVVTNGVASVNGIDNIKKGIRQANALHKLGFFRTWLAVIVIVDGRGETENNFMFRGLPEKDFSNLFKRTYEYALCGKVKLHDDVGIIFFEIVQPKNKSIDHANFISMCVCRYAESVYQSDELTSRIRELTKSF
jgi:uncharacterized protein with HEPN domain